MGKSHKKSGQILDLEDSKVFLANKKSDLHHRLDHSLDMVKTPAEKVSFRG